MDDIKLLPHNEEALIKLENCLNNNQMASINHATGTGKSFILLKYLYENRDKKILFLSPTYPIINQLIENHMPELNISESDFKDFDTMIYRTLLKNDMKELAAKYDLIVLDEYHRCGATKWGKKVNELLNIIKEDYPNTKVIGTTATETRYLDNNRDMNKILFDGVEASRLSLADAILEGILPAPVYVNYNYELLTDIQSIEKNIEKYDFYHYDLDNDLEVTQKVKKAIEATFNNNSIGEYLKDCNKILVFSSTINNMKQNSNFIEKKIGRKAKVYKVHSRQSNEKNHRELAEFRNAESNNLSILYSVDILNEGVHVKDVDAICMMRKTTSPIIYFQQLGRLLAYSKRKDEVIVLDLVNNIRNHPVIYELYHEIVERAKELSKQNPDKKEQYDKVIERFKIVDNTSKICEELEKISLYYKKENILERRLDTAISILEGKIKANEIEKYQAQIDVLKYGEYITPELLKRIRKIPNITKPALVNISDEEFKTVLDGKRNMHAKKVNSNKELYSEIINFFDSNYRLPSIFGESEEEISLAKSILARYSTFSNKMTSFIYDNLSDDISLFERLCYGETINDINYVRLHNETKEAIKRGIPISPIVYSYLIHKYKDSEIEQLAIDKLYEQEDSIDTSTSKNSSTYNMELNDYFEQISKGINEELENISFDEYVQKTYQEIMEYLTKHNKVLEYSSKSVKLTNEELSQEKQLYCKKIILRPQLARLGYLEEIEKLEHQIKYNSILESQNKELAKVIEFMEKHEGALPSAKNSFSKDEVELARSYLRLRRYLDEINIARINAIQEEYQKEKERVLHEYIEFIKINGRKPLLYHASEEELKLNTDLNRWQSSFTPEEREELQVALNSINKYDEWKKTLIEVEKGRKR